jgi:hypothetical protein
MLLMLAGEVSLAENRRMKFLRELYGSIYGCPNESEIGYHNEYLPRFINVYTTRQDLQDKGGLTASTETLAAEITDMEDPRQKAVREMAGMACDLCGGVVVDSETGIAYCGRKYPGKA